MKKRYASYDILRIVAMCFVVGCHTFTVFGGTINFIDASYRAACSALLISANAIFFIISGHFNIRNTEDEEIPRYYYKKFRNILLPALFIFLIRTLWENRGYLGVRSVTKAYILGAMGWYADTAYWFIFTLFGFLVAAPFLHGFLSRLKKNGQIAFLLFGTLFSFANFIGNNIGISFRWGYLFQGFTFTFCIGYFLETLLQSSKKRSTVAIAGIISFGITLILPHMGWTSNLNDISPFYTLYSLAICIAILHFTRSVKENKFISSIASHSFSVYLLHVLFLDPVSSLTIQLFGSFSPIARHLLATLFVIVLSLIAAYIADNLLIKPLQHLLDLLKEKTVSYIARKKASKI